jgi:cardiolipin synthase
MLFTIPNLFTMVRIVMTPFVIYLLAQGQFLWGGWLFGAAAFTDLLDGAVARRFGSITKLGLYLDPIADKILLSSTYIGLAAGGAVPVWIVVIIFGRDLWIVLLSSLALRFTTFRDLNPSVWGKASTFVQVITAVAIMGAEGYHDPVLRAISHVLIIVVAAFAAISAADYSWRGITWIRARGAGRR